MDWLFSAYLQVSITCGALIILLIAALPLMRRLYKVKWRYFLWGVIALRLLLPVGLSLPLAGTSNEVQPQRPMPDLVLTYNAQKGAASQPLSEPETAPEEELLASPASFTEQPSAVAGAFTPNRRIYHISLGSVVVLVWALGCVCFFLYQFSGCFWFWQKGRRWKRARKDASLQNMADALKEEMGLRGRVEAVYCPQVSTPIVVGFLHPCIFVPEKDIQPEELRCMLRHELVHCRRHDICYKLVLVLARGIHWYNPLVHIMARQAVFDLELSCDEEAVAAQGAGFRRAYSFTLLQAACAERCYPGALTTQFKSGKKGVKTRIATVLDTTPKKKGLAAFLLVILFTAALGGCVAAACEPVYRAARAAAAMVGQSREARLTNSYVWDAEGRGLWIEYGGTLRLIGTDNKVKKTVSFSVPYSTCALGEQRALLFGNDRALYLQDGQLVLSGAALFNLDGEMQKNFSAQAPQDSLENFEKSTSWQTLFVPGGFYITNGIYLGFYSEGSDSLQLVADYSAVRRQAYPFYQSIYYGVQNLFLSKGEVYYTARGVYQPIGNNQSAYQFSEEVWTQMQSLPAQLYKCSGSKAQRVELTGDFNGFSESGGTLFCQEKASLVTLDAADTMNVFFADYAYQDESGRWQKLPAAALTDVPFQQNDGLVFYTSYNEEGRLIPMVLDEKNAKCYSVPAALLPGSAETGYPIPSVFYAKRSGDGVRIYYTLCAFSEETSTKCLWYDTGTGEKGTLREGNYYRVSVKNNTMVCFGSASGSASWAVQVYPFNEG